MEEENDDTLPFACFPCGCVIDAQGLRRDHVDVIECPWCGAAFDIVELREWMRVNPFLVTLVAEPGSLVRAGDALYEVVGRVANSQTFIGLLVGDKSKRVRLRDFTVLRN